MKNAALKKLFTDPHFNVMDGLDTYIDDYGKPDPMPEGMLRQMVQSQFLGLFADEREASRGRWRPPLPHAAPRPTPTAKFPADEDADLRLQPDDAAGRRRAWRLSRALAKTPLASLTACDTVHTLLCRREAGAFQRAAKSGDDLLVACTQESRLFLELNDADRGRAARGRAADPLRQHPRDRRLVEGREAHAAPKIAALIAAAQLPDPEPVSDGQLPLAGPLPGDRRGRRRRARRGDAGRQARRHAAARRRRRRCRRSASMPCRPGG